MAGVFTDLKVAAQPGLSARIDVDTRFITSPTALKTALMVARRAGHHRLDRGAGRCWTGASGRRVATGAWRRFWRAGVATWLADGAVVGTLLLWHVVGATSSDDGYNLTIARVSGDAGYVANYYRYFGATEAPFDWYQSVLAHLAAISTAGRVDATARHAGRHRHLAAAEPLGAAAARQAAGRQPGGRAGPAPRCSSPRGCRSTTACDPNR